MNLGSVHGFVHGFVHGLVYGTWFMVSLIMFFLNMVDYPLFFPWWPKILVSAPVPLELILTGFDWVGAGPWGFGIWDLGWMGLDNK